MADHFEGKENLPYEASLEEAKNKYEGQHLYFDLQNIFIRSANLSPEIKKLAGSEYLVNGIGRRFNILMQNWDEIISTAPPERRTPLSFEESNTLSVHLNSFYVQLRGILDNFAWGLLWLYLPKQAEEQERNSPQSVYLSNQRLFRNIEIWEEIEVTKKWQQTLKEKRDPSAHRIPLTVIPQIIFEKEKDRFLQLQKESIEDIAKGDLEEGERKQKEMETLGTFRPFFVHSPKETPMPLYPTILDDAKTISNLARTIFTHIENDFSNQE